MNNQQELTFLSSYLSKTLKKHFGKGPEACVSLLHNNSLYTHIRKFITPSEEILLKSKELSLAINFRNKILENIIVDFEKEVLKHVDFKADYFNHAWNYEQNSGLIVLNKKTTPKSKKESLVYDKEIIKKLESFIAYIHTNPDHIEIEEIRPNILIIKCSGILHSVEKLLQRKGYIGLLNERAHEIGNLIYKNKQMLEEIINKIIDDTFFTWDYKEDKCCLYLFLGS